MDKKFLACLINTRDEEPAALSETEGIDWNVTVLSFVVVSTSQAFHIETQETCWCWWINTQRMREFDWKI